MSAANVHSIKSGRITLHIFLFQPSKYKLTLSRRRYDSQHFSVNILANWITLASVLKQEPHSAVVNVIANVKLVENKHPVKKNGTIKGVVQYNK